MSPHTPQYAVTRCRCGTDARALVTDTANVIWCEWGHVTILDPQNGVTDPVQVYRFTTDHVKFMTEVFDTPHHKY
jgi:hypothetical protein